MTTSDEPSVDPEPVTDREIKHEKEPQRRAVLEAMQRALDGTPNIGKPVRSARDLAKEAGITTYPLMQGKAQDLWPRFQALVAEKDKLTTPKEIELTEKLAKTQEAKKTLENRVKKLQDESKSHAEYAGILAEVISSLDRQHEQLKDRCKTLEEKNRKYRIELGLDENEGLGSSHSATLRSV